LTDFRNQGLFSDHYLRQRMAAHLEWAEDVSAPLAQVRSLYQDRHAFLQSANESQTEAEFIRPMLDLLGYAYIVQTSSNRQGRRGTPDYTLFADEKAKREAASAKDDLSAFYHRAVAIAEAKYWERPLDKASPGDLRDDLSHDNPSFQIVDYLVGTGVPWGILTNGRVWRLYYEKARGRATTFHEVDLLALIQQGDADAFRYFWLFFRREAVVPGTDGKCFLDRVLEQSARYNTTVQNSLKKVVFERVMPLLAQGFIAWRREVKGVEAETREALDDVYRATLTLLYRLLFLLYAEARDLLPVNERAYYRYSLTRLKGETAKELDNHARYSERSDDLWGNLKALFRIVNLGDHGLGVPVYNGDLFREREGKTEVDGLTLADAYLAPALELLTRLDDPDLRRRVALDYKDLDVRQLGSIYEGLLEFHLQFKTSEVSETSEVYLANDKGERKATGSYYTPDYIVDYIITHTLGPLMEERAARFSELMEQAAGLRKQLKRTGDTAKNKTLRAELEQTERQAADALLDVKVCDPAMGSGHFLVRAVDFLTDQIIHILGDYPDNPILRQIETTRQQIAESLQKQGLPPNPERLTDTNLLRRAVMKRCVYGVDLNPMAVELAKVSLWLHSFTVGAPLSFLDHHLRCGNSLIGARVDEVDRALRNHELTNRLSKMARGLAEGRKDELREAPPAYQGALWGGPFAGLLQAAEFMRGVGALSDATVAEVGESERLFKEYDRQAKPYKQLLDIFVSQHFGVKHADEFLRLYGTDALKAGPDTLGEPFSTVMRQARRLYEEKRFFHWDLEFPEVFIDLEHARWKENPGFDAVVGNPPYASAWSMTQADTGMRSAIASFSQHEDVLTAHWDLYIPFLLKAYGISKREGRFSFIIPNPFCREKYATATRRFLLENTRIERMVSFGEQNVFEEVSRHTLVPVFAKVGPDWESAVVRIDDPLRLVAAAPAATGEDYREVLQAFFYRLPGHQLRHEVGSTSFAVLDRIDLASIRLGNICYVNYGAQVSSKEKGAFGKAELVSHSPAGNAKRFFEGKNLSRYEIQWADLFLDYKKDVMYGPRVPELFESPKLILRHISGEHNSLVVAYDEQHMYCDHGLVLAVHQGAISNTNLRTDFEGYSWVDEPYGLHYLLALLASRAESFYYGLRFATGSLQGTYSHVYPQSVRHFPIRRISFTTPKRKRAALAKEGIALVEGYWASGDPAPVLAFVGERLSAEPEQSDVIHDLLAHLAEQMIEMNKEKHAEVKGFLQWLERETGAPVDSLTGKSRVQGYLGDYQKGEAPLSLDGLLDILRKNARRLKADPSARAFQEALAGEYEASLSKLRPLKARLAATDRLIDLIVYRLYGLTDEEIAIVEGHSG